MKVERIRISSNLDKNEYPVEGIGLEEGEEFSKVFGGKLIDSRPKWGNKRMCPRWYVRHLCFKNCNNKASHVPKDKVPSKKVQEMKVYCQKVRAQN